MGNRLSKLYTKTGDQGTTGLADGARLRKDHPRMQAIGSVDELNSQLGVLVTELKSSPYAALFTRIQTSTIQLGRRTEHARPRLRHKAERRATRA